MLLAVDVAEQALELAWVDCAGLNHVKFARMQIPDEWPAAFRRVVMRLIRE
jgi:hypothetical protein